MIDFFHHIGINTKIRIHNIITILFIFISNATAIGLLDFILDDPIGNHCQVNKS